MAFPKASLRTVLILIATAAIAVAAIAYTSCVGLSRTSSANAGTQTPGDPGTPPPPGTPPGPPAPPTPPSSSPVQAAGGVFTFHYDNARTGANSNETILTPANVSKDQFGKLFSYPVDGWIFTQPLYVSGVDIAGKGTFNVIYVGTEHDSVYAFDADGKQKQPLWKVSFIDPAHGIRTMSAQEVQAGNTGTEVGITGTPVIDPATGTLYAVASTSENGRFVQRLHALDIRSGAEKFGGPVEIQASVPGVGRGSDGNGNVVFNPLRQNQRGALLLHHGVLYIIWGSHDIIEPWHGWLMAYDAGSLRQLAVFCSTPDGRAGGIWQSGNGPAADGQGNVYVLTGQGTFSANRGGKDYADSLLKFNTAGGLQLADFFTPHDEQRLAGLDLDFGVAGPVLLPDDLIVNVSKEGSIFLHNRNSLGKYSATGDSVVQSLPQAVGQLGQARDGNSFAGRGAGYGTPTYWNGFLFFAGSFDVLKAFRLSEGKISTTPVARGTTAQGTRGATTIVSANGNQDGIVWVLTRTLTNFLVLHAHDATNVARELYNTNQVPGRDGLGKATKFVPPTVFNGKVYVPTRDSVVVFGLRR